MFTKGLLDTGEDGVQAVSVHLEGSTLGKALGSDVEVELVFGVEVIDGTVEDVFAQEDLDFIVVGGIITGEGDSIFEGNNSVLVFSLIDGSIEGNKDVSRLELGLVDEGVVHDQEVGDMDFITANGELGGSALDDGIQSRIGGVGDGVADRLLKGVNEIS